MTLKHKLFGFYLFLVFMSFFVNSSASEVYKWVDEEGQVHYGGIKPKNSKAEEIKIKRIYNQIPANDSGIREGEYAYLDYAKLNDSARAGTVEKGMDYSQVIRAWGAPTRKTSKKIPTHDGFVLTETWEWDVKESKDLPGSNCHHVSSKSQVPRSISRHIKGSFSGGQLCSGQLKKYTVEKVKYVNFTDGKVTFVYG